MKYYSYTFSATKVSELINHFEQYKLDPDGEYVYFYARIGDTQVRVYLPKKGHTTQKVVFSGPNPERVILDFDDTLSLEIKDTKSPPLPEDYVDLGEQIGSDEVGVGDFFGPLVVTAVYFKKEQIKLVDGLGVSDSKALSDEKIRIIGPILKQSIDHITAVVNNEKYNSLIKSGYNQNKMLAMLHNHVLAKLRVRHPGNYPAYIDQFVDPRKFAFYLTGPQVSNVHFQTKGEYYYPSIAIASVIARYEFLLCMDELSTKYKMEIPLGAGKIVDEFAVEFKQKYGLKELEKITKTHFVNYSRLIDDTK